MRESMSVVASRVFCARRESYDCRHRTHPQPRVRPRAASLSESDSPTTPRAVARSAFGKRAAPRPADMDKKEASTKQAAGFFSNVVSLENQRRLSGSGTHH